LRAEAIAKIAPEAGTLLIGWALLAVFKRHAAAR